MNMPGFTAEVAIYNRLAFFPTPALRAGRTPGGGAVTTASTCPDREGCYCHCGGFLLGPYNAQPDGASRGPIVAPWPTSQDKPLVASCRVAQAFDLVGFINTAGARSLRSLQGWVAMLHGPSGSPIVRVTSRTSKRATPAGAPFV